VLCKIKAPTRQEYDFIREGQIIGAFMHLLVAPKSLPDVLTEKGVTTLCYEEMEEDGYAPLRAPASEIGGRMMPQIAARYMETQEGGRGKLLIGTPGVPAAVVGIIGGGVFGYHAALTLIQAGAAVLVLDTDFRKLQQLDRDFLGSINTLMSTDRSIRKLVSFADVIIGAAHKPGETAPKLITHDMLKEMMPRSLIVDASIDQGGIAESSRPTTLSDPVYTVDGILHYCVPNLTSNVARTASRAHTNALVPLLHQLAAASEPLKIIEEREIFRSGAFIVEGNILHPPLHELHHQKRASKTSSQGAK
jgi:alanine dehydrogenase